MSSSANSCGTFFRAHLPIEKRLRLRNSTMAKSFTAYLRDKTLNQGTTGSKLFVVIEIEFTLW